MQVVIVTGMSGAGKTTALKMFEDMEFYCVDNLPIPLVGKFAELIKGSLGDITNAALGIDIRSGEELSQLNQILKSWKTGGFPYKILFLDASDDILIKRFKETRRNHPLAGSGRIDKGIGKEREKLDFLKNQADVILDTSQLLTRELKQELEKIFVKNQAYSNLYITFLSFGFKYGIPVDCDLVFDVRFLPNPYYFEELKYLTGEDRAVRDFVMKGASASVFLGKLYDMLEFLIPNYILEGKNQLVIGIGCTGGKHRSVTIANELYRKFSECGDMGVKVEHRDIEKDNKVKK